MRIIGWLIVAKQNAFLRASIYTAIMIILASIFLFYFREIVPIALAKWHLFLATIILSAAALINQAAGYRHLLGEHGKGLQFIELLRIWALSNLLNYLGPFQPGTIARSAILKKYNVPLRASIIASFHWAFLSISIGAFLFSLFLINLSEVAFLYSGIALLTVTITWFSLGGRVVFWIVQTRKKPISENDFLIGLTKSLRIGPAHFLTLSQYFLLTTVYFMLYRSFSSEVSILDTLGIATLIPVSTLISVTPNGVGIIESIIAYFSFQFQLDVPEGLFIVLVTRTSHVFVCTGILVFCQNK